MQNDYETAMKRIHNKLIRNFILFTFRHIKIVHENEEFECHVCHKKLKSSISFKVIELLSTLSDNTSFQFLLQLITYFFFRNMLQRIHLTSSIRALFALTLLIGDPICIFIRKNHIPRVNFIRSFYKL